MTKMGWCIATTARMSLLVMVFGSAPTFGASQSKKIPTPLNKDVQFEVYEGTDIALVSYLASRQEFRVGYPPYSADRFHTAEFVIISEHTLKYLRPDLKAQIQSAPRKTESELMANKVFQDKWKKALIEYQKQIAAFKKIRIPKQCQSVQKTFSASMEDEIFLAQKIQERLFASQQIRSRELVREDLKSRFSSRNTEWFDRLGDELEQSGNLADFYPRFVELFIEPEIKKGRDQLEAAMREVGLELATAAPDEQSGGVIDESE